MADFLEKKYKLVSSDKFDEYMSELSKYASIYFQN